ncbi:MAG: hypothetical protein OXC62_17950 [Aestuariivita sp.]|nr:hypothetical protein [Aestuariivita sp.]
MRNTTSGRHRTRFTFVAGNKALTTLDTVLALLADHKVSTTPQATTHRYRTNTQGTQQPSKSKKLAVGAINVVIMRDL